MWIGLLQDGLERISLTGQRGWCVTQVAVFHSGMANHAGLLCLPREPRSPWLDAVGTPIAVQQKLMRHADIRTTLNIYGDVVTNEMAIAHSKVVGLAMNGRES